MIFFSTFRSLEVENSWGHIHSLLRIYEWSFHQHSPVKRIFFFHATSSISYNTRQNSFNFERAKNLFARVTMVLSRAAQMLRTFLKVLQCKNYELFLFTVCFNTRIGRIQDGVVMLVMGWPSHMRICKRDTKSRSHPGVKQSTGFYT